MSLHDLSVYTVAGGTSGICVDLILFPIDTIKTRLQASNQKTNYVQKAQKISKYKGIQASMSASFPCAAIFWTSYEFSKSQLKQFMPQYLIPMFSASFAECMQALVRTPFEIIKTNQQIGQFQSIRQTIKYIYNQNNILGYFSLISRDIPFSIIQFTLYEQLKLNFKYFNDDYQNALNGSIAGAISGFLVTPMDVIKTKQQIIAQENSKESVVMKIYQQNGVKGFFVGAHIRVVYLFFGGFAFFGIYEKVKHQLQKIM